MNTKAITLPLPDKRLVAIAMTLQNTATPNTATGLGLSTNNFCHA